VEAISSVIISKALDGLTLRQQATAQNIAAASGRNFRPMQVDFEKSLRAAAAKGDAAVRDLDLAITSAPAAALGGEPRLDLELATASETAMRYSALLDVLGREMQILGSAARGGQ
jgi:flagellar basal-body rod protein FlgB